MSPSPYDIRFILALIAGLFCAAASPKAAETPRRYCARVVNDDQLRPAVAALAAPLQHIFGIDGKYALETSYYRCAGGHVMLCTVGANLPCGKANLSKDMPPADAWCRSNPGSDFIPMYVTGHDTAYVWRCVGGKAAPGEMSGGLDARGFFADNWKALN